MKEKRFFYFDALCDIHSVDNLWIKWSLKNKGKFTGKNKNPFILNRL